MGLSTGMSDEDLMLAVKKGDVTKLAELFERYHTRLYHFFLRLTYDRTISEDLTQQLFCRIIHYRLSYREGKGYFRSWLYQAARNVYYDYHKGRTVHETTDMSPYAATLEDRNETTGYTEEQYDLLGRALLQLDANDREVIILSRFHKLKYEEIAQVTGKSVPAIKVQVHRALKTLRKIYFSGEQNDKL